MPMAEPLVYACPFCGCDVRVGRPCPGCVKKAKRRKTRATAKPRHHWEQDGDVDGLDLPGGDFDYEEFVAREFGGKPHHRLRVRWYWWLLGVFLLVVMLVWALGL